ncbi:MAG TPA: cytochrome c oxidase subunit II [Dehalococcoidia bacterium]|nr:cytochrome c oxidase subunit II [Dehalococcoidia bacterium]
MNRKLLFRLALPALLLGILLIAGCGTDSPQNTFASEGDVAEKQRDLFYLVMWPAVGVLVIVEGALIIALLRFRRKKDSPVPKQLHGNTRLEIAWTLAPALLLASLAVPTMATIFDLAESPSADALSVKVIARQWSWQFDYPGFVNRQGQPVSEINELRIPVGRDIRAEVVSDDIIHSFWVPRLAGKIDAIPGKSNDITFNAAAPGEYAGQCAEFCGLGHALMRLKIIAMPQAEFDNWIKEQQSAAGASAAR